MRALIVDDSPKVRSELRLLLGRLGWNIVGEAENGVDLLHVVDGHDAADHRMKIDVALNFGDHQAAGVLLLLDDGSSWIGIADVEAKRFGREERLAIAWHVRVRRLDERRLAGIPVGVVLAGEAGICG